MALPGQLGPEVFEAHPAGRSAVAEEERRNLLAFGERRVYYAAKAMLPISKQS